MPFEESRTLASPTGAALHLLVRRTDAPARGVVHVCHGLAEHAARYARFADALAAAGFHTYAHDHRGHGCTKAPDAPRGRFAASDGVAKVLADIDAVHGLIATEHPGLPLIVFGHSMGGIVALNSVLRRSERLAGAAIWNANFSPGLMGRAGASHPCLGEVPPRLGCAVAHPAEAYLRGLGQEDSRQPHRSTGCRAIRPRSTNMSRTRSAAGTRPCPCGRTFSGRVCRRRRPQLCIGPHGPALSSGGRRRRSLDVGGKAVEELAGRMRRMGFSNVISRVWPQTRHEGLNEVNRDEITADFIDWASGVARRDVS